MKTLNLLFVTICLLASTFLFSQDTINFQMPTSINLDGSPPDGSAVLDVQSTTKGMLVPRMTTAQRTTISSPATGLLVFDTDTRSFWCYDGLVWADLSSPFLVADTDGDTKLQVETVPDEDIIRFKVAGNERFILHPDSANFNGLVRVKGNFVSGNGSNTVLGSDSFAAGGDANDATGDQSFVGGGQNNGATGHDSFVGGGTENVASDSLSFVGGGTHNEASGKFSFVGGGKFNKATELYSFIAGGRQNDATNWNAVVAGGAFNLAGGQSSFIGSGQNNITTNFASAIVGGVGNEATSDNVFIGGGQFNDGTGYGSFIGGGMGNIASGRWSFIGGGDSLRARSLSEAAFGTFNTDYTPIEPFAYHSSDRLFVIGNGTDNVNRSNAVTVLKSGFMGIGTDTPTRTLDVEGELFVKEENGVAYFQSSTSNSFIALENNGGATATNVGYFNNGTDDYFFVDTPSGSFGDLRIGANGKTGLGRIAVTNRLEVNGNASKSSAGSWLANSDARLKKNIRPLDSEAILRKMLSLQGVTYEWDDDQTGSTRPEGTMYGFTAQNIREVFPELVSEDNLGFLQTAYGTYDAMTVEAMRALKNEIEVLRAETTEQSTVIANLQTQLSEMDELRIETTELKNRMARLEAALLTTGQAGSGE